MKKLNWQQKKPSRSSRCSSSRRCGGGGGAILIKVIILLGVIVTVWQRRLTVPLLLITESTSQTKNTVYYDTFVQPHQEKKQQYLNCSWSVFAGDSNTRFLWYDIKLLVQKEFQKKQQQQQQQQQGQQLELKLRLSNRFYANGTQAFEGVRAVDGKCADFTQFHWGDNELLITITKNQTTTLSSTDTTTSSSSIATTTQQQPEEVVGCHIITNKFFQNQQGSKRLADNLFNSEFCGTQLESIDSSILPLLQIQRPPRPQFLWFAHGLWGLPNLGATQVGLHCEERFQQTIQDLAVLTKRYNNNNIAGSSSTTPATKFVWATNFLINGQGHPKIRNTYLNWEIACQKQLHNKKNKLLTQQEEEESHQQLLQEQWELFDIAATIQPLAQQAGTTMVRNNDFHLTDKARSIFAKLIVERYTPYLLLNEDFAASSWQSNTQQQHLATISSSSSAGTTEQKSGRLTTTAKTKTKKLIKQQPKRTYVVKKKIV